MLKKKIFYLLVIAGLISLPAYRTLAQTAPGNQVVRFDSTGNLAFPFRDEGAFEYPDQIDQGPLYLQRPANIERKIEYDPLTKQYVISEKVGNAYYRLPKSMSLQEYVKYDFDQSVKNYWKGRRETEKQAEIESGSLIPQLRIDSEAFTNIFGSNVIDIRPQGYVEVSFGYQSTFIDDDTRPEKLRRIPSFDFDQQINMSVTGKIGDKVDMRVNFNTEATFDYENKMNINYAGKEDEILRKIEAGNVSLPLNGTLIQGGTNLFGFKTEMQFGKLNLTTVVSQHKGESETIEVEGGAQRSTFEVNAWDYDENRHFFLSKFFRENYDKAMSTSPVILSNITINKIEVWVTNKKQDFSSARDIVAFVDLGEQEPHIHNTIPGFGPRPGQGVAESKVPHNNANYLYESMVSDLYSGVRSSPTVVKTLSPLQAQNFKYGQDWEKIDQAQKLKNEDFTYNAKLGYISLKTPLNADEVLAVAYNYTIGDTTLQVGEFSSGGVDAPKTLILKLLKGTSLSPGLPTWDLMMKNIYNIGAYDLSSSDFYFNILYKNDSTNTYINYLPEGKIADKTLLRVMNLDNANSQLDYSKNGDGMFDFIVGYTVQKENGRIVFPVLEPFGAHLRKSIGDDAIANKYIYQSIYDSSKTQAEQDLEHNKFLLSGSYKGASGSEIMLNSFNLSPGSVVVTSGGVTLTENVHYTVDYSMGRVKIIDSGLLESGSPISVSTESQEIFSMQRKTMLGTYGTYAFSDKFNMGGTMLYMNERPITTKVDYGEEPVSNLMLGLDFQYRDQSQLLTDMVNYLPFVDTNVKSSFSVEGEVAKLFPGQSKFSGKSVYIDDFEGVETSISMTSHYGWYLASTPQGQSNLFPEASVVDDLRYGYNRAKMAWYYVDPLFNITSYSTMPDHIKADAEVRSNHYTRIVSINEIYPGKTIPAGNPMQMYVLNLAYYPYLRGPYNYDYNASNLNPDGTFRNPRDRWGGIMRDIQTPNFEAANVEYIEFWMLDPFIYDRGTHQGGDLYFNLGNVSEDILKDSRKAFENGLPGSSLIEDVDTTVWGRVSTKQLLNQAFDNSAESRQNQDIGLDGLNDLDERSFFEDFLTRMKNVLTPEAYNRIEADPSSDNYQYFRGTQHDQNEASILDRYKNYNNLQGNSPVNALSTETYSTALKDQPDIEDINKDNTLNELEAYFQYKVSVRRDDLAVGQNHIVDKISRKVKMANGKEETVDWYQFKIPVKNYNEKIGNIDMKSIRFMRMFMTNFSDSIILRFATLNLVRSDWRKYTNSLAEPGASTSTNTNFILSSINIEENENRKPINYVLPPGIEREDDVSNPQVVKMNEQSMLLKINNLEPGDARAVYKNVGLDFRQYKKLKMEVHAEAIEGYPLGDNELTLFVRLASDNLNYYEYEIPLSLTPVPSTKYNTDSNDDRKIVWPNANRMDVDLEMFPRVKLNRDALIRKAGSTLSLKDIYEEPDVSWEDGKNTVKVIGNPTLADVQAVFIGVRNPMKNGNRTKSVEVWVNELRLSDFEKKGGWASTGRASLRLADLGSISLAGGTQSVGWGSINQTIAQRSLENRVQFDFTANFQLGKLLPKKLGLQMPLFYNYSQRVATPEYSPRSTDVKLSEDLAMIESPEKRDSLRFSAQDITTRRSFNLNNISIEPERKNSERKPMPYDIENFSVSYSENEQFSHNYDVEKSLQRNRKGSFNYNYSANPVNIEPFKKIPFLNKQTFALIRDINFNFVPSMISFRTDLTRNYSETLARNNTDLSISMPLNVQKDFLWNRYFDFRFNPTRSLSFDFTNQNISRIDELEGPMDPFLDTYDLMREEIYRNLRNLGRPVDYQHSMNIRYTLPIQKLPLMEWLSSDVTYQGRYEWSAGPQMGDQDSLYLGNKASNGNSLNINANANLLTIYNKVPYLRDINQKFQSTSRSFGSRRQQQQQQQQRENQQNKEKTRTKEVEFTEKKASFKADVPKSIFHKLGTQKVEVVVLSAKGDTIKGELIVENDNRINFKTDTSIVNATIFIKGTKEIGESVLKKTLDFSARLLMMVRSVRASYNQTGSTLLPGFLPSPYLFGGREYTPEAAMFGNRPSSLAPTLPFLMGWQDEGFGLEAANRGWITKSSALNEPYLYNNKETYTFNIQTEPIPNLTIDFTANRSEARNTSSFITYDNSAEKFGISNRKEMGNFDMTIFTLKTAFRRSERLKGEGVQESELFNEFVGKNREVILRRLNDARGFVEGQGYVNYREYDSRPEENGYSTTSTDVLIPAFLAAYTGTDPEKMQLTPFPDLGWLRPNWRVSYTGNPSTISWMKDYVYSLNISHAYRANYTVGQFETDLNYNPNNKSGFSWVRDQLEYKFIPRYDIRSVNIQESFSPLASIDIGFVNDLSIRAEYKKTRNLNLEFTANQLTETIRDEWTFGTGYRFTGLDMIIKTKRKSEKVSNDINLRLDMSSGNYKSTYRKIEEQDTQLFGGMKTLAIDFSADYMLSDRFTMKLFFTFNMTKPHLSTTYETRNTEFGLSFNFTIM